MRKFIRTIIVSGILIFLYLTAYNSYQKAQASYTNRENVHEQLLRESRKTSSLVAHNNKEVIYLAPKGAKAKQDENAVVIDSLVKKTFKYSSPNDFYNKAQYIKNRVEGPFYKFWFGKNIKKTRDGLELEANGSTIKRMYRNYVLVKKSNLHYFAVISTATKLGYDKGTTPNYKSYALDFVWNPRTSRWHVSSLPDVNMQ